MKASFDFSGTSVLVTGASRGIGYGVAEGFAKAGADLIVLAESDRIAEAAEALPGNVRAIRCDISDRAAVSAALADIAALDVLVNNAGLERPTPLTGGAEAVENFDRVIDINVKGTENVTRALISRIRDGGRIILTSSIWGKTAVAEFSAYVASKHANIGLMRAWSKELGPRGITVNAVCPGWVRTDAAMASLRAMAARTGQPEQALLDEIIAGQSLGGLMQPADMAGLYLYLASDAAANITGQAINIDRGEVMA
ncbi:SDR family NAD(P)-dependent oxidoreductase [Acidimangrovimonas pyrenivorans]|uniref:SDR family NAD(P)-dependent oxidoreductase n=1 Tax=Acidimangrovimonas pyrenivorans TaxID=2030798 RepID=A0ABV7AE77_9RHOB